MKILNIICKIAFVFCIVGCVFTLVTLVILNNEAFMNYVIDGKPLSEYFIESTTTGSISEINGILASAVVYTIGGGIELKLQSKYLETELEDGTPFTFEGAKLLQKTAITILIIDIVTCIFGAIVFALLTLGLENVSYPFDSGIALVVSPLSLLFISVIFKYGAEQKNSAN